MQHPVEQIAWFINEMEGNSVRRPTGHGTGPTNVHPTPEGAPRLEGTVSHCDAPNREPQRSYFVSQFSATPH